VIRQSLDPFWDQTLVFPPVVLHGTKEYIKSSPPEIALQAFDQDLYVSEAVNPLNFFWLCLNVKEETLRLKMCIKRYYT